MVAENWWKNAPKHRKAAPWLRVFGRLPHASLGVTLSRVVGESCGVVLCFSSEQHLGRQHLPHLKPIVSQSSATSKIIHLRIRRVQY
jgi:hypothetical protein